MNPPKPNLYHMISTNKQKYKNKQINKLIKPVIFDVLKVEFHNDHINNDHTYQGNVLYQKRFFNQIKIHRIKIMKNNILPASSTMK